MLSSTVFRLATFTIFAVGVTANDHGACWCVDAYGNGTPNVTEAACIWYGEQQYDGISQPLSYQANPNPQCVAQSGDYIMGDQWNSACSNLVANNQYCEIIVGEPCYAPYGNVASGKCR